MQLRNWSSSSRCSFRPHSLLKMIGSLEIQGMAIRKKSQSNCPREDTFLALLPMTVYYLFNKASISPICNWELRTSSLL